MYNENHNEWSPRGRRPNFPRNDAKERYVRPPYYGNSHYPKRRKLETGETEVVPPRGKPYNYESGRTPPLPKPYYPEDRSRREYYQPQRETYDYQRRPEYPPHERVPIEGYRRNFEEPPLGDRVGRKRSRDHINPRFNREYNRNHFSPSQPMPMDPFIEPTTQFYSPQTSKKEEWSSQNGQLSNFKNDPPTNNYPSVQPEKSVERPGGGEGEKKTKIEIIQKMDHLDTEINSVEEETKKFKKQKTLCQQNIDRSNLSTVDRILLANQEMANELSSYLQLFHIVEPTPKSNVIYHPDNIKSHTLLRPRMLQKMRMTSLETKRKTKQRVEEYDSTCKKWIRKLITVHRPLSVLKPSQPSTSNPNHSAKPGSIPGRRRSRIAFDSMKNDSEGSQGATQSEEEWKDPNTRYPKTLATIPPLLLGKSECERKYIDNNRFVEDCSEEFRTHQLANPWTLEEQTIFIDKYTLFPKQFAKIAQFLKNKAITEVICFYFKNKHRLNLKAIINDIQVKKRTPKTRPVPKKLPPAAPHPSKAVANLQSDYDSTYWSLSANSRDRITRSRVKGTQPAEPKRTTRQSGKSKTKPAKASNKKPTALPAPPTKQRGRLCFDADIPASWSKSEIRQFKMALRMNGTDFKAISSFVTTKNHWQCRSFYYNHLHLMNLKSLSKSKSSSSSLSSSCPKKSLSTSSFMFTPPLSPEKTVQHVPLTILNPKPEVGVLPPASSMPKIETMDTPTTNWLPGSSSIPKIETLEHAAPQNWVLDIPPSATFPVSRANNSVYPNPFQPLATPFHGLRHSSPNLRHSFDSSPLNSSETKTSVDWKVSATTLHHSTSGA